MDAFFAIEGNVINRDFGIDYFLARTL